jgi:hypothetical protein
MRSNGSYPPLAPLTDQELSPQVYEFCITLAFCVCYQISVDMENPYGRLAIRAPGTVSGPQDIYISRLSVQEYLRIFLSYYIKLYYA